ncbi:MAG TPA: sigma-54 dependent transcriptional regulator [Candidatus Sumerlaeota bacterium]|nr:sigma-54 dependent transcriptional regulator [Candidatus Sumerlaeota bacterium]HRR31956.1 sigma-54 dependent transcriptional regulator [Candidatus Sumerlaeia bacterium]HON49473.1 sigma-54 dependent transcriptional regulator [Candidatus Sumerlaeota bacterium]HOR64622.1 sigma-54 dependent transcriptional regulator [Candidatus Sumerlaeota bacterium]HPL74364.1 sigma-54 dependent transcriptional regulator [Candidatus Sumerlaeota bacterium]
MNVKKTCILIVDDDEGQRSLLSNYLVGEGLKVLTASTGDEALNLLESEDVSMIISDVRMPGMSGLDLLSLCRQRHPQLPVLMVTAYPDIRDAVGAVKDGAIDYLQKPIVFKDVFEYIRKNLKIGAFAAPYDEFTELPEGVIAVSPQMREVFREAAFVAASDSRILITGESGSGKEIVADWIHRRSPRVQKPYIKINCSAFAENLLESELFGHEKGAFTGAANRRIGCFEEADGGTILLDEIGEMSPALQSKLLRVTQDGYFYRVGSSREIRTNVRILAATNRNLDKAVAEGNFREDLFYRLNVFEIYVPALRERPEDIIPIAEYYVGKFRSDKPRLSDSLIRSLKLYDWPGNVRELRNAMERASLLARGGILLPEHLPPRIKKSAEDSDLPAESKTGARTMEDIERDTILTALRENNYNRSITARTLGISRRALLYKIKRYREQGHNAGPEQD